MKCAICEKLLERDQAKQYKVDIQDKWIATCSTDHQDKAKENPDECRISKQTQLIG